MNKRKEYFINKPLPNSEESERLVLGAILLDSSLIKESSEVLSPEDFYSPLNRRIFAAMLALYATGQKIDPIFIGEELKKNEGSIESIGGVSTITNLTYGLPYFQKLGPYLQTILQKKTLRNIISVCNEISDLALAEEEPFEEVLLQLKNLVSITDEYYKGAEINFRLMSEIVPKLESLLTDLHSGTSYAVPTGFHKLDTMLLDGFSKGDLHVIVGMTGHGKSALALNCAKYQAMQGKFVGVVSREMSDVENAMRLQSSHQQIPRWHMRTGIHSDTLQKLRSGMETLSAMPIAFDTTTTSIEGVAIQTRRAIEKYGMEILYVDYLQLLGSNNRGSRADSIAAVSRGLKNIAMENNIPVVSLSQFNRGAANADVTDLLGHIKESSGVEQDASTVSYIQIDNSNGSAQIKPAKIQVLKNRNGTTFNPILFDYRGETFTFTEKESHQEVIQTIVSGDEETFNF